MKRTTLKEVVAKEIAKQGKDTYIKTSDKYVWDGFSPDIYDVILREDYHIITTFKDGTVKDINARDFIDDKEFGATFDEIKDNIELFMNPQIVDRVGIAWTDTADMSAYGLWEYGKTIGTKKVAIKKIAFPKIKIFPDRISLENRSKERCHINTPHFHVYKNNELIGEVIVGESIKDVENNQNNNKNYLEELRSLQEYVNSNAQLLTEIYNVQDGNKKKELAKQLPDSYK